MTERSSSGASDYLAAERTFLAWIRTGLALMGFGFVVARFGLFLQALRMGQPNPNGLGQPGFALRAYGTSFWLGTALIALGVIVNLVSARNHVRLVQELQRGGTGYARPSSLAIAVAVTLAVLGLAMAIYLVAVREPRQVGTGNRQEIEMTTPSGNGIVTIPSQHSVDDTIAKLEAMLEAKGVKVFALIDHSDEAEKAGLQMRPTKVLIFGSPNAGTPLMVAAPSIAIDLPLKILVWEDAEGKVWVAYNSPAYLQTRHGVPQELVQNIAVVETLAAKAAG
jgi:uncharacterized protein (DUF302 family)/uncharacterized membrane protein YidH (DUF202 family)